MRVRRTRRFLLKNARGMVAGLGVCLATAGVAALAGNAQSSVFAKCLDRMGENISAGCVETHSPVLTFAVSSQSETGIVEQILNRFTSTFPLYEYEIGRPEYDNDLESAITYEMVAAENDSGEKIASNGELTDYSDSEDNSSGDDGSGSQESGDQDREDSKDDSVSAITTLKEDEAKTINLKKLYDFDYLVKHYFVVDGETMVKKSDFSGKELLAEDLTIEKNTKDPQILIYHTHSQERFADSKSTGTKTSVVGLGDYLAELLEDEYGFNVLHHTGQYDVESRDDAYSVALPAIEKLLKNNPSIKVVIDLHRDAGARQTVTINGKKCAKIMFFNGMSRTRMTGDVTYLPNPYRKDNLAFSVQMQVAANTYFPDFSKGIYLKGYRYNMHLKKESMLVEVGTEKNTFEEVQNAMEPLAALLNKVLSKED